MPRGRQRPCPRARAPGIPAFQLRLDLPRELPASWRRPAPVGTIAARSSRTDISGSAITPCT